MSKNKTWCLLSGFSLTFIKIKYLGANQILSGKKLNVKTLASGRWEHLKDRNKQTETVCSLWSGRPGAGEAIESTSEIPSAGQDTENSKRAERKKRPPLSHHVCVLVTQSCPTL